MDFPPELVAAVNEMQMPVLTLPGIAGLGIGMREEQGELIDELAVRILVADEAAIPPGLPDTVAGYPVCIVVRGYTPCAADTSRYPTLVGGIEITNPDPARRSGTMGAVVQDLSSLKLVGLSCFHVVGDRTSTFPYTVWQPTNPPLIQGTQISRDDNIGSVIREAFPNTPTPTVPPLLVGLVDAAVFSLDESALHGRGRASGIVSNSGQPPKLVDRITATARPTSLQPVRKRGFATRETHGRVISQMALKLNLQWMLDPLTPNMVPAFLLDQFEIETAVWNQPFCQKGDSGAIVLDEESSTAVGLLWAADDVGIRGAMSPITTVESVLNIKVAW